MHRGPRSLRGFDDEARAFLAEQLHAPATRTHGPRGKGLPDALVERTSNRVLATHLVGREAPDIIQGIAIAIRAGATKSQFDTTLGIHPTVAEEFVSLRN